jgi:hypothetical protein
MAKLLRHEFDVVAVCPVCGKLCEQHYDFEDVIPGEDDSLGSARQYTCTACSGSYHRDYEPLSGLTDEDIGSIVDHRNFAGLRKRMSEARVA